RRFGHEPVLFERAPELRTRGYIIDFWGLGFEIADRMGLVPALLERCYKMERQRMVDAAGREVAGMDVEGAKRAQIRCANQPAAGAGLFNLFVRHSKFVAVIPATTLAIVARRVTANWGTSTAS